MELSYLELLMQIMLIGFVKATIYEHRLCQRTCGNVTIPYPFGIEDGCYKDKSYYIECNSTTQVPLLNTSFRLNFPEEVIPSRLQVLEVNIAGQLRVSLPIAYSCFDDDGKIVSGAVIIIHTSRFPFSSTLNWFTGVGCGIDAHIDLSYPGVNMNCPSKCHDFAFFNNGSCLGQGCCRATIPQGMTYSVNIVTASKSQISGYFKCGYAFIVEKDTYNFDTRDLDTMRGNMFFPVVLDWSVGEKNCEEAKKDSVNYMCQENSVCYDGDGGLLGYRCKCSYGYEGNPYIANGCKDINECESAELNDCMPGHCENTNGSYTCVCPKGHQGNAKIGGECTSVDLKSENRSVIEGISEGVGGAAVAMIIVYWVLKQRIRIKGRKDFFKQNGGIMLQEMLFTCKDPVNQAKVFREAELKKATENFNEANIIGQGGYGTVFKGVLANKTMVAIKKSKVIDQSQIKQFVNEVIILSQINHQNIVKLLGCCLETPVPLLVYEYVTNNTLGYHIHTHDAMLTFEKRLKIAAETAEALAYMHSTTQIIHRDVKPSNILLNDEFTAKVSDFGISRFVSLGETHLSTCVKGTIGYIDPEYFRTCKLTEKSDVYSFGVVLIELLTGTKIQSLEISVRLYKGAAAYLASILQRDALVQVLDDQLKREDYAEMVKCVAKIAINCLDLEGKTRPKMKEVKQELEQLRCVLSSIEAVSL